MPYKRDCPRCGTAIEKENLREQSECPKCWWIWGAQEYDPEQEGVTEFFRRRRKLLERRPMYGK
jgi:reverse gyrase